jgi:hypothetical protein
LDRPRVVPFVGESVAADRRGMLPNVGTADGDRLAAGLSHPHLLCLAEVRRAAGQPGRCELEGDRDRIAASVPEFGAVGDHAEHADSRIVKILPGGE